MNLDDIETQDSHSVEETSYLIFSVCRAMIGVIPLCTYNHLCEAYCLDSDYVWFFSIVIHGS